MSKGRDRQKEVSPRSSIKGCRSTFQSNRGLLNVWCLDDHWAIRYVYTVSVHRHPDRLGLIFPSPPESLLVLFICSHFRGSWGRDWCSASRSMISLLVTPCRWSIIFVYGHLGTTLWDLLGSTSQGELMIINNQRLVSHLDPQMTSAPTVKIIKMHFSPLNLVLPGYLRNLTCCVIFSKQILNYLDKQM